MVKFNSSLRLSFLNLLSLAGLAMCLFAVMALAIGAQAPRNARGAAIGCVSGTVWFDFNRDRVQGVGEPGLAGVVVAVRNPLLPTFAPITTTTGVDGGYAFNGLLLEAQYCTTVDTTTLPWGTELTTMGEHCVYLDEMVPCADQRDFGVSGPGRVLGRVWHDADGDGAQDDGEHGLPGVSVALTSGRGLLTLATSGHGGEWESPDTLLLGDTYTATVDLLPGYTLTTPSSQATRLFPGRAPERSLDFGFKSNLAVTKRHTPETVFAGWNVWYHITLTNTFSSPLSDIVVTDVLPGGVAPYSVVASTGGVFDGNDTVRWEIPGLDAGSTAKLWIRVQYMSAVAGTWVTNRATVSAAELAVPVQVTDALYVQHPMPPLTPTPTPTATPTQIPSADVLLRGIVSDSGNGKPVAGAGVRVVFCVPRTYEGQSGDEGAYEVLLPGLYLDACSSVTLHVEADGYEPFAQEMTVADLRTQPMRDVSLQRQAQVTPTATVEPSGWKVYLPLIHK